MDPLTPHRRALQALVCPTTRDRLGDDALGIGLSHLWMADCQTCARPLGTRPPSVVAYRDHDSVELSLHHERCHVPTWIDTVATPTDDARLSYVYDSAAVFARHPVTDADMAHVLVLMNPSLERFRLVLRDGRWLPDDYSDLGFTQLSAMVIGTRRPHLRAQVEATDPTTGATTFGLGCPHYVHWSVTLPSRITEHVWPRNGLALVLRQDFHTAEARSDETLMDFVEESLFLGIGGAAWFAIDDEGGPDYAGG